MSLRVLVFGLLLGLLGSSGSNLAAQALPLPSSAPPPRVSPLPLEKHKWVRVETEEFRVLSNAPLSNARVIARDLEELRRAMAELTVLDLRSPVPIWIFLFATDRSMIPYKHRYEGEPASISGAFYSRPYGDYILVNGAERGEARRTVYHEYVHSVLRSQAPNLPVWLEEGLAEFFSSLEWVKGEGQDPPKILVGRPLPRHLKQLARDKLLPLKDLFQVGANSPLYNVFEHQGEVYARSWELMHYLILGNEERRPQAMEFVRLMAEGRLQDEAFKNAFGIDYEDLEKELADYRKKGFPSRELTPSPPKTEGFRAREVSYPQVLVHLGDLLVAQGEREKDALFHFDEALRRNPDHGGAVAGLGLVALEQRDYANARALFRKAAGLAPQSARLHYHYGDSLLVLGRGIAAGKLAEARTYLRRSLELNPSFAPAWARLAASYDEIDSKLSESVLPDDPDTALRLMAFYSRLGARSDASKLFQSYFKNLPDKKARHTAELMMERMPDPGAGTKKEALDLIR